MISELNAFSNIRSREQCRSIFYEDTHYDDFMSRARGRSSCRSTDKYSRYDDDYNYSPDDPWYLDFYPKFDW